MMKRKRRNFSADMKARIALEAIKSQRTIQEIASHYGVHPNQVTRWKHEAIDGLAETFRDGRSRDGESDEALRAELYQQIGRLQMEPDWLKKSPACRFRGAAPMDRKRRATQHRAPVRVGGHVPAGSLLPSSRREHREPRSDAMHRRA